MVRVQSSNMVYYQCAFVYDRMPLQLQHGRKARWRTGVQALVPSSNPTQLPAAGSGPASASEATGSRLRVEKFRVGPAFAPTSGL
jgi:hypothetical protein